MKKALTWIIFALALTLAAAGCSEGQGPSAESVWGAATPDTATVDSSSHSAVDSSSDSSTGSTDGEPDEDTITVPSEARTVSYSKTDLDATWDVSSVSHITLAGSATRLDGTGGRADGSVVTITAAGTYVVSGTLDDGQIIVDLEEDDTVRLVLNGASITCSHSAPIHVKNADKVVIVLADGTQNLVTDGSTYVREDSDSDEPNAAIFSESDLTINGTGSLTVRANHNNGIASKDDLKIVSGAISVDAVNDALKGRDCLGVRDGTITLTAGGDGLQSTNDEDAALGHISIEGGTLDITAGTDGIQAQTTLTVVGGDITLSTGGGSVNGSNGVGQLGNTWGDWGQGPQSSTSSAETNAAASAKGLKAGAGVYVLGGAIAVDSSDDSIHSNAAVRIGGGIITLTSGDDGVHADGTLLIDGGELTVTQSYEGLESGVVTINAGTIRVTSADDAINVAGGADESSVSGRPGQGAFTVNEDNTLSINGGYVVLNGEGDGLDCNGRVFMTAGTVLITGPTNNGNGAVDYLGEFTVSGGYLVAVGSSGMAQSLSESSTQGSILVNFDSAAGAGTMVHVEDQDATDVCTFVPGKQYQSLLVCSPEIVEGSTLTVYLGGESDGVVTDGLYTGGAYSSGTEYVSLQISGVVTTSGAGGGMTPGGGPGGGDAGAHPGGDQMPGGGMLPGGGFQGDDNSRQ